MVLLGLEAQSLEVSSQIHPGAVVLQERREGSSDLQQHWLRQQPGEHPTHCQGPGSPWEQDWMRQHLLVVSAPWQKLL